MADNVVYGQLLRELSLLHLKYGVVVVVARVDVAANRACLAAPVHMQLKQFVRQTWEAGNTLYVQADQLVTQQHVAEFQDVIVTSLVAY